MRLSLWLFLFVLGCGSLATQGVTYPESCQYYDSAYLGWSATSSAAAGLAGASATATTLVEGLMDDPTDATIGLGVTGAVMGVLATVASMLAGEYADRFAENCRNQP